jgi:26S proteasome regulatory subunit N10
MRIVIFVGSPIEVDKVEMEKLAKRLKKEKVNVDIVSFGDHQKNNDVLTTFINTLNGKDGTGSHLVSVPRGSQLQEALISSPIIQGEDGLGAGLGGAGFEFGVDPNEDPELALALRVSMEEQRQRQEEEQRRAQAASAQETEGTTPVAVPAAAPTSDEAMLERALALSTETPVKRLRVNFLFAFVLCLTLSHYHSTKNYPFQALKHLIYPS